jgi:hypothetical protein
MTHSNDRLGVIRSLTLPGVALLLAACSLEYRASVPPVEDEVVVQAVADAQAAYDHPVRLSEQDIAKILKSVRVQFTANWLQRFLTGPLPPVPLFDEPALAKVVPVMAAAMGKAGTHERIVFYVGKRRGPDRRDVTTGSLFVKDRLLTIMLVNYQNRVDVIPGLPAYDRTHPEMAVAPQRFTLVFDSPEYVVPQERGLLAQVFGSDPPTLRLDYTRFLRSASLLPGLSL